MYIHRSIHILTHRVIVRCVRPCLIGPPRGGHHIKLSLIVCSILFDIRQVIFVVLQSNCSDLFLPLCFRFRRRLGPSSVQYMQPRNRWSVRRRSDLGLRPWWMPKANRPGRLCRRLGSRTCGVGPNPSRIRLSRNQEKRRLQRERSSNRNRVRKLAIQSRREPKADRVPDSQ